MIKKIIMTLAVALVAYLGGLYLLQEYLMFFPDKKYVSPANTGVEFFEEMPMTTLDGELIMSWYAKGDESKPLLLFFHGNAGQIATFAPHMEIYHKAGFPILMMEYRGYANSGGKLSQDTMYADAIRVFDYAKEKLGHKKIVCFGYSLGTAAASALSVYRPVERLVLMAPFVSMEKKVSEMSLPFARYVLKNKFPSIEYVEKFEGPLLVVHGKKDTLLPYHHGVSMFEASKSDKKSIELLSDKNHNKIFTTDEAHQRVLRWLMN